MESPDHAHLSPAKQPNAPVPGQEPALSENANTQDELTINPPALPDGAAHPADVADEGSAMPPISMKDLFGGLFEIEANDEPLADPALVDTRSVLRHNFGPFVREEDINWDDSDVLQREMQANMEARHRAEVERLFGVTGTDALVHQELESFSSLYSTLPAKSIEGGARETWLMEMPKIAPNRQTMHADPQPFRPRHCPYLTSDARMLYTPANVIRWAHQEKKGLFMSNTRIVRWSDGSVTLHIGTDVHTLQQARANTSLTMLGTTTVVSKNNTKLPAISATVKPDKHFILESSEAASIELAIINESLQNRSVVDKQKLPYLTAALPSIDWRHPGKGRNPYEEYVAMEYERRRKEIDRRMREGNPMSLTEQMRMEQEMMEHLMTTNAAELIESQEEARRAAALRTTQRGQLQRTTQRSRLDRDLGLTADAGSYDANLLHGDAGDASVDDAHDADDTQDEYAVLLDEMRGKRAREDAEDRQEKIARLEHDQAVRFTPLVNALQLLAEKLPTDSDAYGSVAGTLDFLRTGSFSSGIVEKEVPLMLKEVSDELPHIDTSSVREAFQNIMKRS